MIIKKYTDFSRFGANMYVVGSEKRAIIIDPCVSYQQIKKDWEEYSWDYIVITHGHYDHFTCLSEYLALFPMRVLLHKQAIEKLGNPALNYSSFIAKPTSIKLESGRYVTAYEGLSIPFGLEKIKIMETPGHSNCSISIVIQDCIFTGDTLFQNSVGRCDLFTGNSAILKESLRRFYHLKKEYNLYPGHDEVTTLLTEKKDNPYMRCFYELESK